MSLCWPLQMPPTPKAVLISLADNANDQGECFPSIARICERTCLSERAVQEAIGWLERRGALSRSMQAGRSTVYTLRPAGYQTPASGAPPQQAHPRAKCTTPPQQAHPTPAAGAPITVIEPSSNRQKKNALACPDDVEAGQWSDWLALRKAKRAPVSATALDGIRREAAAAGMTLQAALAECCSRGWTGFKAEWVRPRIGAPPTAADRRAAFVASLYGHQPPDPRTIDVEPEPAAPRLAIGGS